MLSVSRNIYDNTSIIGSTLIHIYSSKNLEESLEVHIYIFMFIYKYIFILHMFIYFSRIEPILRRSWV